LTADDLHPEVLIRLAELEVLTACAGLTLELVRNLDAEALTAALADGDGAAERLRLLLARLPAEGGPREANRTADRSA
jgi:hypothetical protein